jgi:RNA polymerase sigma-70 factor (ECF subfamily)
MKHSRSYSITGKSMDMALAELIRLTQEGDQDAFGLLFERYKNLVYRTAYLMLNDREAADETLQEVFLKVYRSLSSYQPAKGAFTTWLYRITTNDCLNRLRRNRFSFVPLEWDQQENTNRQLSEESRLEEDQDLHLALSRLSDKLRAAIVLRYFGKLSYAEIAGSLGIPIGTVKSRLDLGLRTLRRELAAANLEGVSEKDEVAS